MKRKGLWLAAAVACALAAPLQTLTATSGVPIGSTVTSVDFCPDGAPGTSYPGVTAPAGCAGDSTGVKTVTVCRDANVHAFVSSEIMEDGRRPALVPLAGTVAVHLQSPTYGHTLNVFTSPEHGTGLLEIGPLPVGSYSVTASLWTGTRTASDGSYQSYPSSKSEMTLVVSESPCGTTQSTGVAKNGCGVGDANHAHAPKSGKACPTK